MSEHLKEVAEFISTYHNVIAILAYEVLQDPKYRGDAVFQAASEFGKPPYTIGIIQKLEASPSSPVPFINFDSLIPTRDQAAALTGSICTFLWHAGIHNISVIVQNKFHDGVLFRSISDNEIRWKYFSSFPVGDGERVQ